MVLSPVHFFEVFHGFLSHSCILTSSSTSLPSFASATYMTFILLSCSRPTQFCNSMVNAVNESLLFSPLHTCGLCSVASLPRNLCATLVVAPVLLVSRACNLDMVGVASSPASTTLLTLGWLVASCTIWSAFLVADPCGAF